MTKFSLIELKRTKRTAFLLILLLLMAGVQVSFAKGLKFTAKENALLKKNFYMLYLLEDAKTQAMSKVLQELTTTRAITLKEAINSCQTNACFVNALQLSPLEIRQIGEGLVEYATVNPSFLNELRSSKYAINFDKGNNADLISKLWELDALALNRILAVYVNGEKPAYPKIDAGDFTVNDPLYFNKIKQMLQQVVAKEEEGDYLAYRNLLAASLKILLLNERDEAIRYEPLAKGWNKSAVKKISKTAWSKYAYSVILVPGLGPEQEGVSLDPKGAIRCDSAAKRYFAGLAPFIVVSGGHVHPNKTPFAEAVEMKKYLIATWKIPASAILIEPHARHTTTNLRNLNRMIYRFNIPTNKSVMIVTDVSQSSYILGNMAKNALRELGYLPYATIRKISETETAYLPNELSLHANPFDTLDP